MNLRKVADLRCPSGLARSYLKAGLEVVEQIEANRKLGVSYIVFNIRDLVKVKFAPLELLAKIAGSLG